MRARAEAVEATRERIARAAMQRFLAEPYDDVTIASVARDAGVSHQTLLNHFESKDGLFAAAAERFSADLAASREGRATSDPESVVALLMEQFERSGDGNVRLALLHDRIEAVRAGLEQGRAHHQGWLAEVFEDRLPSDPAERRRTLAALHAATDVYTWKLLRRDLGHGRRATQRIMTDMVRAILYTTRKEPCAATTSSPSGTDPGRSRRSYPSPVH
jgi:AcrR family transcriptional regulator